MKKYAFILAAICACMVLSCTKETPKFEEDHAAPAMRTVTITASIDDVLTKTSYAGGTTFSWTKGDQISVYCSDGNFYPFTADATGTKSSFSGSIPEGATLGSRAFFPADAGHNLANYIYHIPETKDMTEHPSADIPMSGKKGEDNSYTFTHCSGATKLTITNIPAKFESVQISIASPSLKLSGDFSVYTSGDYLKWNPATASTDSEKRFSRKVVVKENEASIYIPYASGAEWWGKNVVNVTGYDSDNTPTALVTDKEMSKSIGTIERAHVLPLTPLPLCFPVFDDINARTCGTSRTEVSEMKAYADNYYLHIQFKGATDTWTGTYLALYIYDGKAGEAPYKGWATTAENSLHNTFSISTSALSVSLGGKSCITSIESSGGDTYWTISIPRSASTQVLGSGTAYIGLFTQASNWAAVGAVPEIWANEPMVAVSLP